MSDYMAGIKGIGAKYQVDVGVGLIQTGEGKFAMDRGAFFGGKNTAYTAIKKAIATAVDPAEKAAAEADLSRIDYWYQQIEGILGAPGGPGAPGAPGGQGGPGGLGEGVVPGGMMGVMGAPKGGGVPSGGDQSGARFPFPTAVVEAIPGPPVTEAEVAATAAKWGVSREDVILELVRRRSGR